MQKNQIKNHQQLSTIDLSKSNKSGNWIKTMDSEFFEQ
jgi:hypothetical protein